LSEHFQNSIEKLKKEEKLISLLKLWHEKNHITDRQSLAWLQRREVWAHKTCLAHYFLAVMVLCVRDINFSSFFNFSIEFWKCSDNVVLFPWVPLYTGLTV
jgi:hypothetical protein